MSQLDQTLPSAVLHVLTRQPHAQMVYVGDQHQQIAARSCCRTLSASAGRAVIPQLRAITETDPDSEVRRLAALSLKWWKAAS
jgi:hypothetical protein